MADIVDRVRKLLELAQNNSSPEEAALAAARAQELMFKHQIRETDLAVEVEEVPEATVDKTIFSEGKRRSAWKASLANGIAKSMGCYLYSSTDSGFKLQCFGLESQTQAVSYMFQYLVREIESQAQASYYEHGQGQNARSFKNSFCLGAVNVIWNRLQEQARVQAQEVESMRRAQTQGPACTGLVRYDENQKRVDSGYKTLRARLGLRTVRARHNIRPSAYGLGRSAGSSISLGGGTALNSPRTQVE